MTNGRRKTQLQPKIRTDTRAYSTWYHTVRQHRKQPGQRTVATASKHRQKKGGSHEIGRFYRNAAVATDRHRKPAALLFLVASKSLAEALRLAA